MCINVDPSMLFCLLFAAINVLYLSYCLCAIVKAYKRGVSTTNKEWRAWLKNDKLGPAPDQNPVNKTR